MHSNADGKTSSKESSAPEEAKVLDEKRTTASVDSSVSETVLDTDIRLPPYQPTYEEVDKEMERVKKEVVEDVDVESPQPSFALDRELSNPGTSHSPDSVFDHSINNTFTSGSFPYQQPYDAASSFGKVIYYLFI